MATVAPCVSRSAAAILTLYERSVLVFFEITIIVYMYISTMATVAPCVSRSAAAILTCMKGACFLLRSSVVIFRLIHICQHKGMGHEVKLLVNLQKKNTLFGEFSRY